MTAYRIRTADKDPSWISFWDGTAYAWCRRSAAQLFAGRDVAKAAATAIELEIVRRGYCARLLVVPATGGMPIAR